MTDGYILRGKEPVLVDDAMAWADWYFAADRHVAKEKIGDVTVSTVFIGIDHQFGDGPPLLFETLIFGGEHDGWQDRCSTWDEAEKMHREAVSLVKGASQ